METTDSRLDGRRGAERTNYDAKPIDAASRGIGGLFLGCFRQCIWVYNFIQRLEIGPTRSVDGIQLGKAILNEEILLVTEMGVWATRRPYST